MSGPDHHNGSDDASHDHYITVALKVVPKADMLVTTCRNGCFLAVAPDPGARTPLRSPDINMVSQETSDIG
jgi:hypothetical protein